MPAPDAEFPEGRWRARWIWASPAEGAGETRPPRRVALFRRAFDVEDVPLRVPARIVSVSRYVLYCNGEEIARGPLRASRRRQPFDVADLAPMLQRGRNTLDALVWVYGRPMPWWRPPVPSESPLLDGAFALEALIGSELLASDARWQALRLDGWTMTEPGGLAARGAETIMTGELPKGWPFVLDDDGWSSAVELLPTLPGDGPRGEPPTYPLAPAEGRMVTWPSARRVRLVRKEAEVWTTDELVAGTIALDLEGPAGTSVEIQVAEQIDASGRPRPTGYDGRFTVVCSGERQSVETLDAYGLTGALVGAHPDVVVHELDVVERLHPLKGDHHFRASDERLEKIWAAGRRTVTLCSWDAYIDCPTREQRAWTGDAVVHQMVDLATNADWTLARWHPHLSAVARPDGILPMAVAGDLEDRDSAVIPDWSLHWVHSVWNLYRYLADTDEIASLLPVAEGVLRWFDVFTGPSGVPVDVPGGVLIDWASVYTEGACSALCGLWGRGLVEFAEMADWVGDGGRAAWARATHARLAGGFEIFWDSERQRYVDVVVGGEQRTAASQHGQAAAIVGRLAPASRWSRLVEVLTGEEALVHAAFSCPNGPAEPGSEAEVGGSWVREGRPPPWWDTDRQVVRAQPFFRYVVHDALVAAGQQDQIASLCLDWETLRQRCPSTLSETWFGGTICHGWSATPTRDLITSVLGIRPSEPGFAVAMVEPALGSLEFAGGSAPTPFGPVEVEAGRDAIEVNSPVPFISNDNRYPAGRHRIVRPAV